MKKYLADFLCGWCKVLKIKSNLQVKKKLQVQPLMVLATKQAPKIPRHQKVCSEPGQSFAFFR
jgi:hypothetical protein